MATALQLPTCLSQLEWPWPCFTACLSYLLTGPPASLPVFSSAILSSTHGPPSTTAPLTWPMAVPSPPTGGGQPGDIASLPGFSSVPPKLIKKILAKEYVDMYELLPETWQLEAEGSCCHSKRPRRSLIVTDISIWTECFATMAAILASAFPEKAPQFFAYLRTITKASRTFEGSAWASYDMTYRRQAANRGSLDWGIVDAALYNEAFAGRAKLMSRCRYCLADTHPSQECLHAPVGSETYSGAGSMTESRQGRGSLRPPGPIARTSVEICRLFNSPGGSRCRFQQCRYAHVCSRCRRPHPAAECGERRPQAPAADQQGSGTPALPPTSTA